MSVEEKLRKRQLFALINIYFFAIIGIGRIVLLILNPNQTVVPPTNGTAFSIIFSIVYFIVLLKLLSSVKENE